MDIGTVRKKIVLGFSAVILLMVALCAFAYIQLRNIEAQAVQSRNESIPGLYLTGRLHAVSISTYTSVQQLILERDPSRMQQIRAYLEDKTAERLGYRKLNVAWASIEFFADKIGRGRSHDEVIHPRYLIWIEMN